MELLNSIEISLRYENGPVRLSILDRYKEISLYLMGKLESIRIKYIIFLTINTIKTI